MANNYRGGGETMESDGKSHIEKPDDTGGEKHGKKRGDKGDRKKQKGGNSRLYVLMIFVLTFFISLSFSYISEVLLSNAVTTVAVILLVLLVFVNIVFDVIGVAVTSCSVEPFLSMASRKIKGARMGVKIVKNAEKVSNICADVVGDICGIISGALGAAIVAKLVLMNVRLDQMFVSILFQACIAAVTVGGKALGKKFAMDNCQKIVFNVARILSVFSKK